MDRFPDPSNPVMADAVRRGCRLARACGLGIVAAGVAALPWHWIGVDALARGTRWFGPNESVAFIASGLALILVAVPKTRIMAALASGLGLAVAMFASLVIAHHDGWIETRVDAWLPSLLVSGAPDYRSVSMSSPAAGCFLALGVGVTASSADGRFFHAIRQTCALLALFVSGVVLAAFLYGFSAPNSAIEPATGTLATFVAMLVLALGVLIARAERGIPHRLMEDSISGRSLRRLLPLAIAIPVSTGLLGVFVERLGWIPVGMMPALTSIATAIVLVSLVWEHERSVRSIERDRAEIERLFRSSFENTSAAMALVGTDGRWLLVNDRLCRLLGASRESLMIGRFIDLLQPDDRARHSEFLERLKRPDAQGFEGEQLIATAGGKRAWVNLRVAPQRDERGTTQHFIYVMHDVTARRQTEERLRMYERVVNSAATGIAICDALHPDHPIMFVNDAFARITGYPREEVLGKNCRFLNREARDQDALARVRTALAEGADCSVVLLNHRRDGTPFWNALTISPVREPDGRVTHWAGILEDVTSRVDAAEEHKRLLALALGAKAEEERASRAKDEFLSMVSHELRSPMNAMSSWLSLMRVDEAPETRRRAMAVFDRAIRLQVRLINDLLDASRIASGKLELAADVFGLGDVVRATIDALSPSAAAAGIVIEQALDHDPVFVRGDEERVEQVVRNLLDNALKFTRRGGHVQIALTRRGHDAEITVADDGIGIAPEILPHVFDRFRQENRGGTKSGLGLGLSIVRHIVQRLGGSVTAESEGVGKGARFVVRLPTVDVSDGRLPRARTVGDGAQSLAGLDALVVEDDDVTLEALRRLIENAGATARTAPTLESALAQCAERRPEVLISDIQLPDGSGLDLIQSLRAGESARTPRVLAIATTGIASYAERLRALAAGFDHFLSKPVDAGRLIGMLAGHERAALSRRVLLVDNDAASTGPLAMILGREGFEVRTAESVAAGLDADAAFRPEIVVTDFGLPDGNGAEFARELRRLRGDQTPRIVALTGRTMDDLGADAACFDAVLTKPVDVAALIATIAQSAAPSAPRS